MTDAGNVFSQFDDAPATPLASQNGNSAPPQDNVFSQFDEGGAQPTSTVQSLVEQPAVGFNSALASIAGAPGDIANWASGKLGGSNTMFAGSDTMKKGLGLIGANPDDHPANTTAEKILRSAGSAAASMVAPEAAVGTLTRAGVEVPEIVGSALGTASSPAATAKNVVAGLGAGAGGEAARDLTPDRYKPLGEFAGNVIGGAAGAGLAELPGLVGQTAHQVGHYLAPLTEGGQQAVAGERLASAATSPRSALDMLENAPGEILPGSNPTTFQQTGDMGLGALERQSATANPAAFMTRRADQNAARVGALEGVQPTGDVADVPSMLRSQLADIDSQTNANLAQSLTDAQGKASALGGMGTPEDYGTQLRGLLSDAEGQARTNERGLWQAVDPENNLTLPSAPVVNAAKSIEQGLPKSAAPLSGEERAIFDVAQSYPSVIPFNELTALRSRLSTAMRNEMITNGQSPSYARMVQLRGGIENAISDGVANKAGYEAQQVAAGAMAPEDTMAARLQQQQQDWYANRDAAAGQNAGTVASGNAGAGQVAVSGARGTAGQGGGGFGNPTGSEGVSATPLQPNFTQSAADRLTAASQATKERVGTFKAEPVGKILRKQGMQSDFRLQNSAVPDKAFHSGPTGFEDVQAIRKAAGDVKALPILQEVATAKLRKSALNPDGTVDPKKLATFRNQHADALRAFPALDARFSDAAKATETMAKAAVDRKTAIDDFQKGATGKLLGVSDPQDVVKAIGGIFGSRTAVRDMKDLATKAAKDPNAMQGLRKAVADFMMGKFLSNAEAGTSGVNAMKPDAFQAFLKSNEGALRQVFKPEEINSMRAIAADLKRANRSVVAVKLPGTSSTPQDTHGALHSIAHAANQSLLGKMMAGAFVGSEVDGVRGAVYGAAGAVAKHVISGMRDAGIAKVDDLIRDAMLNPEMAKALLAKAPLKSGHGSEMTLAQRLKRLSVLGAAQAATQ